MNIETVSVVHKEQLNVHINTQYTHTHTCTHTQGQAVWYEGRETYLLPAKVVDIQALQDTATVQDEGTGEARTTDMAA